MKPYPPIDYATYLKTEGLLNLQQKRSSEFGLQAHDEMLFIIVHQTYELWFKQILTEVDSVLKIFSGTSIPETAMGIAVARLQRVTTIQKLLIDQVSVLETMTPLDFLDFRDILYPASGFQSTQFRLLENKLGLRPESRLTYNALPYHAYVSKAEQEQIKAAESSPSLFNCVEKWLERTPVLANGDYQFWQEYQAAVQVMFNHDRQIIEMHPQLTAEEKERNLKELTSTLETFTALFSAEKYEDLRSKGQFRLSYKALHAALFVNLYRDQPLLQLPFRLLVALQDIDENFTTWRYRHALMAHRMLGDKIGTGGSTGARYLKAATEKHRVFSDFFNLATFFIPRSSLPALPEALQRKLGFTY